MEFLILMSLSVATLRRVKCVVSNLDLKQSYALIVFNDTKFISLSPTEPSIIIIIINAAGMVEVQSFPSWCHLLILMSHQSYFLIVFNEANFISLSLTQLSIIINTAVFWLTWPSDRVSWLRYGDCRSAEFLFSMSSSVATPVKRVVYNLSVTSKVLSDSRQWSKLHFSLTNESIHHHSSFLTNMTVGQSSSTKLVDRVSRLSYRWSLQSFSSCRCHYQ